MERHSLTDPEIDSFIDDFHQFLKNWFIRVGITEDAADVITLVTVAQFGVGLLQHLDAAKVAAKKASFQNN